MPLPATIYDSATFVPPTADLTDFTLLVDLSRMSAAWWAAVDTSDATRGRAAKSNGTELAVDWLSFNGVDAGWARIKWSGTLNTSGPHTLRIYPPLAANAAVAAGDTYGQYAAYDASWEGYWPLIEDANDRTVNARHGTAPGGQVYGGHSGGPLGAATTIGNLPADEIDLGFAVTYTAANGFSIGNWSDLSGAADDNYQFNLVGRTSPIGTGDTGLAKIGSGNIFVKTKKVVLFTRSSNRLEYTHSSFADMPKYHFGFADDTEATLWGDGIKRAASGLPVVPSGGTDPANLRLSRSHHHANTAVHSMARGDAWADYDHENITDQATHFGTWTNNPAGGPVVATTVNAALADATTRAWWG